ncbi:hypothetical protein IE81DRAFT_369511 [Ceraceosorus guamensis]|uniref:Polysaccharide lyase 14 domain-containing protein n=1 Tax=Ceraceosorus guamensis TaxID=1522189 RepID=A0A316VMM1_9BASI|nr:hypothetical protein IE81DRAFT_369511 [Ceraceosorus guamensis]PWN38889.1 hypothetical protein IE81DRAFT_369511 [Ceraceosorus guamensis]
MGSKKARCCGGMLLVLSIVLAVAAPHIVARPLISTQSGGRRAHRNSVRDAPRVEPLLDARQLLDGSDVLNATSGEQADGAIPISSASAPGLDALIDAYGLDSQAWTWDFPAPVVDPVEAALAPSTLKAAIKRAEVSSDASEWLSQNLNLYSGRVLVGAQNLEFEALPANASNATTASPRAALKVTYPKGSYAPSAANSKMKTERRDPSIFLGLPRRAGSDSSSEDAPLGGTSFYAQPFAPSPNSTATLPQYVTSAMQHSSDPTRQVLLLRYTVHVPIGFDFVKGGKLPGLYSSVGKLATSSEDSAPQWDANTDGCSGGSRDGVGASCWSVRAMWRQDGKGEAYAYFPTDVLSSKDASGDAYDPCGRNKELLCNDDYGTSMNRGSFELKAGSATSITLLVVQNSAPDRANGAIYLWADSNLAIAEEGLLLRTGTVPTVKTGKGGGSGGEAQSQPDVDGTAKAQWVDKIFFSSFFGGSTADYAATSDSALYFSDLQFYAGDKASSLPGTDVLLTARLSGNASSPGALRSNGVPAASKTGCLPLLLVVLLTALVLHIC